MSDIVPAVAIATVLTGMGVVVRELVKRVKRGQSLLYWGPPRPQGHGINLSSVLPVVKVAASERHTRVESRRLRVFLFLGRARGYVRSLAYFSKRLDGVRPD